MSIIRHDVDVVAELQVFIRDVYKSVTVRFSCLVPYILTLVYRSLFWHADQDFFDKEVENHLHNSTSSIERAIARGNTTPNDLELLKQANLIQLVTCNLSVLCN